MYSIYFGCFLWLCFVVFSIGILIGLLAIIAFYLCSIYCHSIFAIFYAICLISLLSTSISHAISIQLPISAHLFYFPIQTHDPNITKQHTLASWLSLCQITLSCSNSWVKASYDNLEWVLDCYDRLMNDRNCRSNWLYNYMHSCS